MTHNYLVGAVQSLSVFNLTSPFLRLFNFHIKPFCMHACMENTKRPKIKIFVTQISGSITLQSGRYDTYSNICNDFTTSSFNEHLT